MKRFRILRGRTLLVIALIVVTVRLMMLLPGVQAQLAAVPPRPVVAVHVSELTQHLETIPNGWWTTWHYFVMPASLEEALRSDGTPFVEVTDADIAAGSLLYPDGTPRYPVVISLAAEAVGDNEIAPLRNYVAAGGMLVVGSSAFTRNADGTSRTDFALANEMGLHMVNHNSSQNWYVDLHFTRQGSNRLTAGIPSGGLAWRMPLSADEIPLGSGTGHAVHGSHYVFRVSADSKTTVLATGDSGPLLATVPYGKGNFIYHGDAQPLIGHTVYDPSLYAYLIYRHAIEWAFEANEIPIIRLSPWRYDYNAAFVVRHDFESDPPSIRSIESSAIYENNAGARGDYFFCTGALRQQMSDVNTVVASIKRAVTRYGATIGSHNGGLKNPVGSFSLGDFDYWHWGPDEALDVRPSGYSSGAAYAQSSILRSFQDIEGWLAGTDNGRPGCGAAGNCPRIWVAPYMNATREPSYGILQDLGVISTGEQKIGPFPTWALSTQTAGKRYNHVSIPTSDWFVGGEVPGAIEWGHTTNTVKAAVDFYYGLGAFINLYSHIPSSSSSLIGQFMNYSLTKPRMWAANAVEVADWWKARSHAIITPAFSVSGSTATATVTITGATDPDTSIEVALPEGTSGFQVYRNGSLADPADYRTIGNIVRVRVGTSVSSAEVRYTVNPVDNPVPAVTSLSPSSAAAGGPAFTLTVNGSGFVDGSTVLWNGSSRTTTYVSPTQLAASIASADLGAAGTASVSVQSPAPGGGISNARDFTITGTTTGGTWTQTDWSGGSGQAIWSDATRFDSASGIDSTTSGQISLATSGSTLFSDDFTRTGGGNQLSPWTAAMGTWTVSGGVMQGTGPANEYSYAYVTAAPQWTDYTVQCRFQMPSGAYGGGIGGRVNTSTGAHYGAWVYPGGSTGGPNMLRLWKFRGWTDINGGPYTGTPMRSVSLTNVGTGWHTLQMTFQGSRIQVSYDGTLMIDTTDNNYDSRPPYLSGGVSVDWWTWTGPYTITVDDVSVSTSSAYGSSGVLTSSAFDGGDGVQWQSVSWDAATSGATNICVRTRTADSSSLLAAAPWSNCYSASGSGFLSGNSRWIQYQAELSTSDTSVSPVLSEIRIPYDAGVPGAPVPVISSLNPTSAQAGGAAFTLTVNGSGFVNGSTVRWNGADRTTTYVSSTRLTAGIPASDILTAGTATVTVLTPAPGGGTSNAQAFTITAADNPVPLISSLTPTSVQAGESAFTLTVTGSGFVNGSTVRWNGSNRTTTYVSSTRLTAGISASDIVTAGTATVTVFTPAPGGGTSNARTFTITAADNPVPATTSIAPNSAIAGGAAFTLTVNGVNFVVGSVVRWSGSNRTTTYVSSARLTAGISASDIVTAGTSTVTVFNPAPGGGTSNGQTFSITVADNPVPATTSMTPMSATAGGAAFTLTVNGNGFMNDSIVRWNGSDRTTTYVSSTQLTAAINSSDVVTAGTATVTVFNTAPGGGTSNSQTFTITAADNPVPTIIGVAPISATAGGAAFTLTVNGDNFVSGSVVRWNGSDRATTYVSSNQLTAGITASDIVTAGTATVTVFNPAPGGGTSNGQTFSITVADNPVPITSNIAPTSATAGDSGFTLTVNGGGFVNGSTVRWNGSNRTTTYVSSTRLTAGISASDIVTAGTATVTVFTPAPGGGTSNARTFTITAADNPVPATTSIAPSSATAGGSSFTLTINGNGFMNDSIVRWNGSNRTTTYVSSTQLTAAINSSDVVTAGAATVTVFNPAPGGGTSNSQIFTITAADNPVPTTTSIAPASATAGDPGFTLTVNGSGFIDGSTVRWNGSDHPTTYVSSTRLTAAIPATDIANAGTANVAVFTSAPGGGISNTQIFTINATNNPVPTTTSIAPTSATAGDPGFTLTMNGTNFVTGSVVRWNGLDCTTTFVSSTQLNAEITASDIAAAGTAIVTAFTPAPGGGTSNAQVFTINAAENPVPTISYLRPSSRRSGSRDFTLTVYGAGFVSGSVVRWNGADRATTYISETRLTAAISSSDIARRGSIPVTVFNPTPGGGTSNAVNFRIR